MAATPEVLASKRVLTYLVRNPTIAVMPLLSHRRFRRAYLDVDCRVLPSLQDTFSITVGVRAHDTATLAGRARDTARRAHDPSVFRRVCCRTRAVANFVSSHFSMVHRSM